MIAVDKVQVARQFSRAASVYPRASSVQNKMADRLMDFLPEEMDTTGTLLDLGCGTGYLTGQLCRRLPRARVYGLDIAPGMIEVARENFSAAQSALKFLPCFIEGDIEKLPFAGDSVSLVVSNAALQWTDLQKSLSEIQRVLEPGGVAALASFIDGTLGEWHSALGSLGLDSLHHMPSMGDFSIRAEQAGLVLMRCVTETYKVQHSSVVDLLQSTKQMGATNARPKRRQGLMGRQVYGQLVAALEAEFPTAEYCSSYQAGYILLEKHR